MGDPFLSEFPCLMKHYSRNHHQEKSPLVTPHPDQVVKLNFLSVIKELSKMILTYYEQRLSECSLCKPDGAGQCTWLVFSGVKVVITLSESFL